MLFVRHPVQMVNCSTTWRQFGVSVQASQVTLGPALWISL